MSETLLIGKAKELFVATLLVARKLHVYFPLVDSGFDLLVMNPRGDRCIPVQVKYQKSRTGLTLDRTDAEKFLKCSAVLAFGSGDADVDNFYFVPAKEWHEKADDRNRGDGRVAVYLRDHSEWAKQFLGNTGLDRSFHRVLS